MCELVAELMEQVFTRQLFLECMKHPRFDLVAANRQVVRTQALFIRAEQHALLTA
jgi:hypothetical protein